METFILSEDYIPLDKLLKTLRFAQSGGDAHYMVDEGLVKVNRFVEKRRRAKIRAGDVVEVAGRKVNVVGNEE